MRLRSHEKRGLNITIMLYVGASFSLSLTRKLHLFLPEGHYPWLPLPQLIILFVLLRYQKL